MKDDAYKPLKANWLIAQAQNFTGGNLLTEDEAQYQISYNALLKMLATLNEELPKLNSPIHLIASNLVYKDRGSIPHVHVYLETQVKKWLFPGTKPHYKQLADIDIFYRNAYYMHKTTMTLDQVKAQIVNALFIARPDLVDQLRFEGAKPVRGIDFSRLEGS